MVKLVHALKPMLISLAAGKCVWVRPGPSKFRPNPPHPSRKQKLARLRHIFFTVWPSPPALSAFAPASRSRRDAAFASASRSRLLPSLSSLDAAEPSSRDAVTPRLQVFLLSHFVPTDAVEKKGAPE